MLKGDIFMEEVLEREVVPAGYEDIVLYDDYGKRVTNPVTLRSIAEAQDFLAVWLNMNGKSYNAS